MVAIHTPLPSLDSTSVSMGREFASMSRQGPSLPWHSASPSRQSASSSRQVVLDSYEDDEVFEASDKVRFFDKNISGLKARGKFKKMRFKQRGFNT